jgi:uncharacterized protein (TIGR02391 family)
MAKLSQIDLHDILIDIEALKNSMEMTMRGNTADHAKWVSFKRKSQIYCALAVRYNEVTGDKVSVYDISKLSGHMDTVWPVQKENFETIYNDVLVLHGRLTRRLPRGAPMGFDDLLHPLIQEASSKHYLNGDYRNAVLDAIVAVFDQLRKRSGLDMDGDNLCNQALSIDKPILILSELDTDSGRNDQRGFLDIFKGFYRGVRNPKAHSLVHDLDATKAAQHLVLASILMQRVMEAQISTPRSSKIL